MILPEISIDILQAARRSDGRLAQLDDTHLSRVAIQYRQFLGLAAKYPDQELVPTPDIDDAWHLHLMQPRAYQDDCRHLFGDVLDHDAGFGKDSPEQLVELRQLFQATAQLWEETYGEPYQAGESEPRVHCRCCRACRSVRSVQ